MKSQAIIQCQQHTAAERIFFPTFYYLHTDNEYNYKF